MSRRPNIRAIRLHRSYTVDELARTTGACKATVRRWLKTGLPAVTDKRPALIVGEDAIAFLKRRGRPARKCRLGEFYCLSCREPRRPALGEAEIASRSLRTVNVRALCEVCVTVIHTRVSLARLDPFRAVVRLSDRQASPRLKDAGQASPDVHLYGD